VHVFGNYRWWENLIVHLAGPAANCIAGALISAAGLPATGLFVAAFGLINLAPIPGSDGWRAIKEIQGALETNF
jgi:hypothetical protein